MKLKHLLFAFVLLGGFANLNAQEEAPLIYADTVDHLIITEARYYVPTDTYLEITNVGDSAINLNQFYLGDWGNSSTLDLATGQTNAGSSRIPLDTMLQPGASIVIAPWYDYTHILYAREQSNTELANRIGLKEVLDWPIHRDEGGPDSLDQKSPDEWQDIIQQQWWGSYGFFIEQGFPDGSTMVIDQVNGIFTDDDGTQVSRGTAVAVAGIEGASQTHAMVRRHNVTTGTLDFFNARGTTLEDSEWIPVPLWGNSNNYLRTYWTLGNHDDYNLDENTLVSDVIDVDFTNKTLTVPWGIGRNDDIMNYFEQKPGIAWEYKRGTGDSTTFAAQPGDTLAIYVCGNELDYAEFVINVNEPAENVTKVLPKFPDNGEAMLSGIWGWPRVTEYESGQDTIWGVRGGIPYDTPVDSLLKYLDKPSNADWEIVFADGVVQPDVDHGDKLKVIAADNTEKEYFIVVRSYRENDDALLNAITWPDIPNFYRGLFGWLGDTIPGFNANVFTYNVEVPLLADGVPAFVAHQSDVNSTVEIDRATSLTGSLEDRKFNFTVTAEDDTTINDYSITLTKQLDPANVQPYQAEPIISEVIFNWHWRGNDFMELVNTGNQPIDLSNYMLVGVQTANPAEAISETNAANYGMRYEKYIPGRKWAPTEGEWVANPYVAQTDLSVNSRLEPGDVFTMGAVNKLKSIACPDVIPQLDVQFYTPNPDDIPCGTYQNQWGEEIDPDGTPFTKFHNYHLFLFKILNEDVKNGTKPATDPDDFELIDVLGMGETTVWQIDGEGMNNPYSLRRNPDVFKGNPVPGASLNSDTITVDDETTIVPPEWYAFNMAIQSGGFAFKMTNIMKDLGQHFFLAPTHYISTIASNVYKVSGGYSLEETIKGVTTGTTVAQLYDNLLKKNAGQTFTVTSTDDGTELDSLAVLSLNDTLNVLSADSVNTTKYVLDVTENGLNSDAGLNSDLFDVAVDVQPTTEGEAYIAGEGSVSGFGYETTLRSVVENISLSDPNASMSVIDSAGEYVPFQMLNYDTVYVDITVNEQMYIEVIAEDGVTMINYQLQPDASQSDAYVMSQMYSVNQADLLIGLVPQGTNVQTFLSHLIPSGGATLKVLDKMGYERTQSAVKDDDNLLVTSADNTVENTYFINKLSGILYMAYILSDVYDIDQVAKVVNDASAIDVSDFLSRIRPSQGATVVVVDQNGDEKTSGNIEETDMVSVTSGDGSLVVMYTFGTFITGTGTINLQREMEFYPNPTNEYLNVAGVEAGQRILVYNYNGVAVEAIDVEGNIEVIPMQKQPAGIYLIVVSDDSGLVGTFKAIKK